MENKQKCLECHTPDGTYRLINGQLYLDKGGRQHVLSFCLDDPKQSSVVALPMFVIKNSMVKRDIEVLGRFRDDDGTEKHVFQTNRGIIEVTYIKNKLHKHQEVYCIPTHHYCTLGCKFCHLTNENKGDGKMVKIAEHDLAEAINVTSRIYKPNILFSFMGVGEPFLNKELIVNMYERFVDKCGNLSISLATMMPTTKPIDYFIDAVKYCGMPLKIHFSLHSPIDSIRNNIIPCSQVTVQEGLEALVRYRDFIYTNTDILYNLGKFHSSDSPVLLHYTVIEGVNDTLYELEKLIEIGEQYHIPLKILKFNPTSQLKRSKKEELFVELLTKQYPAPVKFYAPPGANIGSSCGQFTKHYYLSSDSKEELKDFERWKEKYQVFDIL